MRPTNSCDRLDNQHLPPPRSSNQRGELLASPKWGVNFRRRSPPLGGQYSTPNNTATVDHKQEHRVRRSMTTPRRHAPADLTDSQYRSMCHSSQRGVFTNSAIRRTCEPLRSYAHIWSVSRLITLCMARCELPWTTVPRAPALHSNLKRYRHAYGAGQLTIQRLCNDSQQGVSVP